MISEGRDNEWYNEITREMDLCICEEYKKYSYSKTYMIFDSKWPDKVIIRYPGATRGCVEIDDNCVIKAVAISQGYTKQIYNNELEQRLQKFVGQELIWPEGVKRWTAKTT